MVHAETKIELVTDNGKRFHLFQDISFGIMNKETNKLDRVFCRIIGIVGSDYADNNGYIVADQVEINGEASNQQVFHFIDMKDINYVYYD